MLVGRTRLYKQSPGGIAVSYICTVRLISSISQKVTGQDHNALSTGKRLSSIQAVLNSQLQCLNTEMRHCASDSSLLDIVRIINLHIIIMTAAAAAAATTTTTTTTIIIIYGKVTLRKRLTRKHLFRESDFSGEMSVQEMSYRVIDLPGNDSKAYQIQICVTYDLAVSIQRDKAL